MGAWLALGALAVGCFLVYGLAGADHHIAERMPFHLHLASPGQPVPDHTHGFQHAHQHPPAGVTVTPAGPSGDPAIIVHTLMAPILTLLAELVLPVAILGLWLFCVTFRRSVELGLTHQILRRPPTRPPAILQARI